MTAVGSVVDGKYEILKEIGRGGMSVVYLAMDKRLNKQWAVKEILKKSNGQNDEIVVNSLLAEANMIKRLDHPALPRIVDIIDNGASLYVVMDYIEGESIDKIIKAEGPQPEEMVIEWAKQICDAMSYLHSQKPPIIYRDMKPANVMLKPERDIIKIIDFGIAREYKEAKLADTTVLGTKGYASPEAYTGQTDARSDIFSIGMTMHHMLTGIDPRNAEAYAPVRNWRPELSEGIEIIIDRCVEPAAENRYQTCADLLYDLQHPELITKGFKAKQKRKAASFFTTLGLSILFFIIGIVLNLTAINMNNQDYDNKLASSNPDEYYAAIEIYPDRYEAYDKLIEFYKNSPNTTNTDITKIGNIIEKHVEDLDVNDDDVADLYYDLGKLYISNYDDVFKGRAIVAEKYLEVAVNSEADFEKKEIAQCYYSICQFMTKQSVTAEHSLADYNELFKEIDSTMKIVDAADDSEANYDKISLYYVTMLLINDQAEYMAGVGFKREEALKLVEDLYEKSNAITSTLESVNDLKDKVSTSYPLFTDNINAKYNEVEKRQQGR